MPGMVYLYIYSDSLFEEEWDVHYLQRPIKSVQGQIYSKLESWDEIILRRSDQLESFR